MPTAFERFHFSFFEDQDSARQGLDLVALGELTAEERARAEALLMAYLPDSRGVIGLGVLRSVRAAPALLALFEAEQRAKLAHGSGWYPYGLIAIARALWQIDRNPRWPASIIAVLTSASDPIERQTAAQALCDIRDPAAVTALRETLDAPEPLVRYHAGRGLLIIHGVMPEAALPPVGSDHMLYRVMSKDPARREGGKQDILAAIAGR
jgi:HEAT repeat protein